MLEAAIPRKVYICIKNVTATQDVKTRRTWKGLWTECVGNGFSVPFPVHDRTEWTSRNQGTSRSLRRVCGHILGTLHTAEKIQPLLTCW